LRSAAIRFEFKEAAMVVDVDGASDYFGMIRVDAGFLSR